MTLLHRLRSVVHWIIHRSEAEQGLNDELQSFLDMSVAEKLPMACRPLKPVVWRIWNSAASSR